LNINLQMLSSVKFLAFLAIRASFASAGLQSLQDADFKVARAFSPAFPQA
jgi:hypothetical protein